MRKFLIISHGNFAVGIADTLKLFLGEDHPFYAISAYGENNDDVDVQIEKFMSTVQDNDELLVFTDIMGGSVNNKMMVYLSRPNTYIIAGMNLAMLIQSSTIPMNESLTIEKLQELVEETRMSIVIVNEFATQSFQNFDE